MTTAPLKVPAAAMPRKPLSVPDWLFNALDPVRCGRLLARRGVRLALAWAAAGFAAVVALVWAWHVYDHADRPDGNDGHVLIDFSGQWLMGRVLARGRGPDLYRTDCHREALAEAYPPVDAGHVLSWLIDANCDEADASGRVLARLRAWAGVDCQGVGGALYPPIHALLYCPLGALPPQAAYRVFQVGNILLTFVIGFLVEGLTRGRVWAPVAVIAVMLFPGFNGAVCLGQNSLLSLAVLLLGWLLIARGRPWAGGAVWGLLAFKPVWAAAFLLALLLTRRWRAAAAMLLVGAALAALTLPWVGGRAWLDWLAVGRTAAAHYSTDENWIFLSRDLQDLPHRWLLHFRDLVVDPNDKDALALCVALGRGFWVAALVVTVGVALWRWKRPAGVDGPPAAFVLLGAWLSCIHFMYYDVMLAGLPVCLLFTDPGQYLKPVPLRPFGPRGGWVWNAFPPTMLALLVVLPHVADGVDYFLLGRTNHYPPFDTFCLIALWLWCGWKWLREPEPVAKDLAPSAVPLLAGKQ